MNASHCEYGYRQKRCCEFLEHDPKQKVRIVGLSCINLDHLFFNLSLENPPT